VRILLYTGKGGAGKTTIAAATAVRCAETNRRTLLVGGDGSQSLADCLNSPLTDEPQEVGPNLWAQEIDPLERLERSWPRIEALLGGCVSDSISGTAVEELTMAPGLSDLLRLLAFKEQCDRDAYDVIVVDLGSSLSALQLLAYPEGAAWWIGRLSSQKGAALSSVAEQAASLAEALADFRHTLGDAAECSVRLVTTADQLALRETKRALTFISLYGYNVDAVVLNRQRNVPRPLAEAFSAWPILCTTWYDRDVIGQSLLSQMALDLFPVPNDPASVLISGPAQRLSRAEEGYVLSLKLPFVEEDDIELLQHSGQLILQVGRVRRVIQLPDPVDALSAADAVLDDGCLEVHFR